VKDSSPPLAHRCDLSISEVACVRPPDTPNGVSNSFRTRRATSREPPAAESDWRSVRSQIAIESDARIGTLPLSRGAQHRTRPNYAVKNRPAVGQRALHLTLGAMLLVQPDKMDESRRSRHTRALPRSRAIRRARWYDREGSDRKPQLIPRPGNHRRPAFFLQRSLAT